MKYQNSDVSGAVREAGDKAVRQAMTWAVYRAVYWTVDWAVFVDQAVFWAVFWAVYDPEHPALEDFLRTVEVGEA